MKRGVSADSGNDAQNVAFLHDKELLSFGRYLGARPFAKQYLVACLDIKRRELARPAARADGSNHTFLRLLLGGIENDDLALRFLLTFETPDRNAVVEGTESHTVFLLF